MADALYQKLLNRWEEVTDLPRQDLGPLTPFYQRLVKHLKVMPWPLVILVSIVVVLGIYSLLGTSISYLVTILQRGF